MVGASGGSVAIAGHASDSGRVAAAPSSVRASLGLFMALSPLFVAPISRNRAISGPALTRQATNATVLYEKMRINSQGFYRFLAPSQRCVSDVSHRSRP